MKRHRAVYDAVSSLFGLAVALEKALDTKTLSASTYDCPIIIISSLSFLVFSDWFLSNSQAVCTFIQC